MCANVHHWEWCQHIEAAWEEDSQWLGACYSQTSLLFSHNPSYIGPAEEEKKIDIIVRLDWKNNLFLMSLVKIGQIAVK